MSRILPLLSLLVWLPLTGAVRAVPDAAPQPTSAALALALDLATNGQHDASAIEFRRLALDASDPQQRGGFFWMAAYEYARSKKWDQTTAMLDRAEDAQPDLNRPALLLRAEAAQADRKSDEELFFLGSLVNSDAPPGMRQYAARKKSVGEIRAGQPAAATATLKGAPGDNNRSIQAVDQYTRSPRKSPIVGGVLGLAPGLGYAYSEEYANALRSLILNGLFIYGMVDTGMDDSWGAFAVITFFEITWYSGSIYGGIDAAQNFNRRHQDACVKAVMGDAAYSPDFRAIPTLTLKFRF